MVVTRESLSGEGPVSGVVTSSKDAPKFDTNPEHPDEVVQPVREVPSRLVSEAQLRHEQAQADTATFQERKQAAVEQAHALSTRPDGSYAQLHETESPSLAVGDDGVVSELRDASEAARDALVGSAPAGSPAAVKADEVNARQRADASAGAKREDPQPATQPATGQTKGAASK